MPPRHPRQKHPEERRDPEGYHQRQLDRGHDQVDFDLRQVQDEEEDEDYREGRCDPLAVVSVTPCLLGFSPESAIGWRSPTRRCRRFMPWAGKSVLGPEVEDTIAFPPAPGRNHARLKVERENDEQSVMFNDLVAAVGTDADGLGPASSIASGELSWLGLAAVCERNLWADDRPGCVDIASEAYRRCGDVSLTYDLVFSPALHRIGEMRRQGVLSYADEDRAVELSLSVVGTAAAASSPVVACERGATVMRGSSSQG